MVNFYERLKQKDETAFSKLYHDYVKLIYHIAYSYTRNKEDAEDITSDVFVKIINSIDSYEDVGKFKEWICQITRNVARNYVTRDKHKDNMKDDDQLANYESHYSNHREMLELFETYLDDITIQIMILRFIYNYKFKEIAIIMNMTIGKVQGLYYDGIEKLKEVYKNEKN